MSKSVNQSRIQPSKLVMAIAAFLLAAFTVAAIVLGINIPVTTRIKASDGGKITSLIDTNGEDWFISTNKANLMRMNAAGETLETYDVKALAAAANLGDIGYIKSLNKTSRDSQDLYVFTSTNHLIQLREKDGQFAINGATVLSGVINSLDEKDGILYTLSSPNEVLQISKFNVEDLSAGAMKTGYVYSTTIFADYVELDLMKRLTVLWFEIVEEVDAYGDVREYVHIVHPNGILRFTTDFQFNGYQDTLRAAVMTKVQEKIDATEGFAEMTAVQQNSLRNQFIDKASQEVTAEYASEGIVEYNANDGKISFNFDLFIEANTYLYSYTEEAFRGCGYNADKQEYYLVTKECSVYVCPLADLPKSSNKTVYLEDEMDGVTLPYMPKGEGVALFYNDDLKVGYVAYQASNRLSRIDFETGEMTFTTKANDDIRTLIQNANGESCYYVYLNKNEAASGEFVLRRIDLENQEYYLLLQALTIVAAVLAVVSALVLLVAALCVFKAGFSEKFLETMRLVKKHWAIYVVVAASFSLVGMFCYYPAIGSIALSFFDYTVDNESKIWNNFANYIEVFTSTRAALEFGNMFLFLACDIFTALLPPLIFAFFLTIMRNKQYSAVMRTLLFIPGIIPGIATTLIWKSGIYDYPGGVINIIIQLFNGKPFDFMHHHIGTRISIIMMGFPFVGSYLIFYGAMMNVPDSYYEAAELDGITVVKRFAFIDVPLIFAQIKYVLIMTFISSVQNFGRTYMTDMNNIYETNTPIHTMYKTIQTDGNYGLASAYATVLFVFLFAATVFNMYSQKRDKEEG